MTYLVIIAFVAILTSLGAALFFMLRGGDKDDTGAHTSQKMARALAARVGISIFLFVCVLAAWKLGYIQPTGIRPGQ